MDFGWEMRERGMDNCNDDLLWFPMGWFSRPSLTPLSIILYTLLVVVVRLLLRLMAFSLCIRIGLLRVIAHRVLFSVVALELCLLRTRACRLLPFRQRPLTVLRLARLLLRG